MIIRDLSERRRAEEFLREQYGTFRKLAVHVPGAIYQFKRKPDGTYSFPFATEAIRELFGCTPEDVRQDFSPIAKVVFPEARDKLVASIEASAATKTLWECEVRVQIPGFPVRWLFGRSAPETLEDGSILWHGFVSDITENKEAREALGRFNEELEEKVLQRTRLLEAANRELEAFSYSVSHDLRAPLRAIQGFSKILLEEYLDKPLDGDGKSLLERVSRAAGQMGLLIDDLLKLSRVTRADFHHETFELSQLAQCLVKEMRESHPDQAVDVSIEGGVMVQGDRNLMKIAMMNLLNNAWKFSAKAQKPRIEFGRAVIGGKGETAYFVRDNGVGFDMAYADKLFNAFQRLHSSFEFPGTGIGLATAKRIISRHGGHIWAEGEVGKGATVYFTLP
jgi:signal transduction histidine kinase